MNRRVVCWDSKHGETVVILDHRVKSMDDLIYACAMKLGLVNEALLIVSIQEFVER